MRWDLHQSKHVARTPPGGTHHFVAVRVPWVPSASRSTSTFTLVGPRKSFSNNFQRVFAPEKTLQRISGANNKPLDLSLIH